MIKKRLFKKGTFFIIVISLLFSLIFIVCQPPTDGNNSVETDSIIITSVIPNSGLVDKENTSFTVIVEYNLGSSEYGELDIGFNNNESDINIYSMLDVDKIVNKGSGNYTFEVFAIVKDWESQGDFEVFVYLSEHPHDSLWSPLESDTQVLTF
ncbi:MAG: hypothetical protein KAT05_06455 [Spirochaetes bacterium]|nr:hypothetical protein [Spirochaetota bacterium]